MQKIFGALGSLETKSCARLEKNFLKISTLELESKYNFLSSSEQMLESEVAFCGRPKDLRVG